MLNPNLPTWIVVISETPFPSYHTPLRLAQSLGRTTILAKQVCAIQLLKVLLVRYPYALAIGQELVFVLMEAGEVEEAERWLKLFEKEYRNLDEEFLCRWGRLFKDKGDFHANQFMESKEEAARNMAVNFYRKSLEKYDQAYQDHSGYYPGINKATLLLILGALKAIDAKDAHPAEVQDSVDLAEELFKNREKWRPATDEDREVWVPATMGEAGLLGRKWGDADKYYRDAVRSKLITEHSKVAMQRQVERILKCFEKLGIPIDDRFKNLSQIFGTGIKPADAGGS